MYKNQNLIIIIQSKYKLMIIFPSFRVKRKMRIFLNI